MKIILVCHSGVCGHREEIANDEIKYCPICGDELVRVIIEEENQNEYE